MKSLRNNVLVDMTAEEVSAREAEEAANVVKIQERKAAKAANDALKASAKSKLMAGEALTEAEAGTIVI